MQTHINERPSSGILKNEMTADLSSEDSRRKLAKLIMRLFELWQLDQATQLNLLGLSVSSRSLLAKYRNGEYALSSSRDTLDRIGWLLAIHKALRLLYPRNEQLRYSWINHRNKIFNNLTPLQVMKDQGIIGLARVAGYLDYVRGQ